MGKEGREVNQNGEDSLSELRRDQWYAAAEALYGDESRESGVREGSCTREAQDRIAIHATFEAIIQIQATITHLERSLEPLDRRLDRQEENLQSLSARMAMLPEQTKGRVALHYEALFLRWGMMAAAGYCLSRWIGWGWTGAVYLLLTVAWIIREARAHVKRQD